MTRTLFLLIGCMLFNGCFPNADLHVHEQPVRELDPVTYNRRGAYWLMKGAPDRAIVDFKNAIEINPHNGDAYYNLGLAWLMKDNPDRAIIDFNSALKLNPHKADAYNNRGATWHKKGDFDKAIADYNLALKLNPLDAIAYSNRGTTWLEKGAFNKAIADYNNALELNPNNANAYYNRGNAWKKKGDYDQAIADYVKTIKINPRNHNALNNFAWLLATCSDTSYRDGTKAVELAQKALAIRPKDNYLDTLAAAYAEVGKFEDAIRTQERVIAQLKKEGMKKDLIDEFKGRLNSYEEHKPWREK
jgi:tetratricopeptide (TPR) repeat protein